MPASTQGKTTTARSGLFVGGLPSFGGGWGMAVANGQYITSLRINNLTNGVCYDFVVQSVAVDGTVGYPSTLVGAAPFSSQDWWQGLYKSPGWSGQRRLALASRVAGD